MITKVQKIQMVILNLLDLCRYVLCHFLRERINNILKRDLFTKMINN